TGAMLEDWGLPRIFIDAVAQAHDPEATHLAEGSRARRMLQVLWAHGGELEMLDRGPTGAGPGLCLLACFPWPEADRASAAPSLRNDELAAT
ncbi:MAG: hypothetical protein AzoDbin1_03751, partial [Azoarcus sp.]|nr:hypothetical protein [Azoarcus sp.]